MKRIYHPPTKFCAFPSMGYWEIDGKPVSSREALDRMSLCDRISRGEEIQVNARLGEFQIDAIQIHSDRPILSRPIWKESEVARELHLHTGWIEELN